MLLLSMSLIITKETFIRIWRNSKVYCQAMPDTMCIIMLTMPQLLAANYSLIGMLFITGMITKRTYHILIEKVCQYFLRFNIRNFQIFALANFVVFY